MLRRNELVSEVKKILDKLYPVCSLDYSNHMAARDIVERVKQLIQNDNLG